jgi:hypothetical protein
VRNSLGTVELTRATNLAKPPRPRWLVSVLVVFPLEEKRALVLEAQRRGLSVNDLVLVLLGAHCRVPVTLSGRRPWKAARFDKPRVVLRMSPTLRRALRLDAICRETNLTDLVRRVVAEALHLEIDLPKSPRRAPFGGGPRHRRALDGRSQQVRA